MIWLASYPRSGNTFFRNVLYEVFAIESLEYNSYLKHRDTQGSRLVKTHQLPYEIDPVNTSIPAVYLIRDGRDAVVSMAHQRKNITEIGSNFRDNLIDIITPQKGVNFGGWSRNVDEWLDRASVVIRFEKLIADPLEAVGKIGGLVDLSNGDSSKLPTFDKQKSGEVRYIGMQRTSLNRRELAEKFFRRGKVGGWKDDMPKDIHQMFWDFHGKTMERCGYHFDGSIDEADIEPRQGDWVRNQIVYLASYPRSGNTFARNILNDVYGIESSSYYDGVGHPENYRDYRVVKTHMLPDDLQDDTARNPGVCIIRDGRDCVVSMAHQRKDLYEPETNFEENLREAIVAAGGSYFGGWGRNVAAWVEKARVVIRFRDLIRNPMKEMERIRNVYELPKPKPENMPSFESMKFGFPKYGRGTRIAKDEEHQKEIVRKSFRRGKVGSWKTEMPKHLSNLFWCYHGDVMERLGYGIDGEIKALNPDFDYDLMRKLGQKTPVGEAKIRVLIDASKIGSPENDGIKRYVLELLRALYPVATNRRPRWIIDLLIHGKIIPLAQYGPRLFIGEWNQGPQEKPNGPVVERNRLVRKLRHHAKHFLRVFFPDLEKDDVFFWLNRVATALHLPVRNPPPNRPSLRHLLKTEAEESGRRDRRHYDIVHVSLPQHYFMVRKFVTGTFVVTIHDFTHRLFRRFHTRRNVALSERGMKFFLRSNTRYIAISDSTASDAQRLYGIKPDCIRRIYEAANRSKFKPLFDDSLGDVLEEHYRIPKKPFLMTLSTIEPRKNLHNTIRAFAELVRENPELDARLVVVGRKGWKTGVMEKLDLDRVIFTGFVDDAHLPVLFNCAKALCYVSFYEGFGLPPLEAMSCGTPVIYGDNSSMAEIFHEAGLPADPRDISSIKEQMRRILTDESLCASLREKSVEKSLEFSWRQTAEETLGYFEDIVESLRSQ